MAMDINLGRLAAYVRLDFSKLKGDQDKAKKSIKDFQTKLTKDIGESFSALGSKMSLGVTAPLLALGKAAVDAAKDFDSLKRGLTAVAGSSAEAERQMKRLKEVAKLPGLSFEQAVQGSIRLQAAGFSAQLAERSLKAFGNALATVGKGSAELEGVNLALSQIMSKGKVSAEEINQIAERVPQIRKIMIAAFGTADTEILQKAKITSEQFVKVITGELEKLPKVTGGVANSFENFQDTMRASLAELGKAILPDLMKAMKDIEEGVKSFIGWWTKLPDATKQNILHFAEFVAVIGPLTLVVGSIAGAVANLTAAFTALKTATIFLRTPGGLVGAGALLAAAALTKVAHDLMSASANSTKNAAQADASQRAGNPKGYWLNQINSARNRMMGQTDPSIIAANKRMIANAEAQMREVGKKAGGVMGPPAPSIEQRMQEQLKAQLRAQIAAGAQEAAARKAEIAARKAEAARNKEEARKRRIQAEKDRHQNAVESLMRRNESLGQTDLDQFIREQVNAFKTADALRKAQAKGASKVGGGVAGFSGAMSFMPDMLRVLRDVGAEKMKKGAAKLSSFMGGASDALSAALGSLSPLAEKAAEVTAAKRIALEDKIAQHSLNMGRTSLTQYQEYLQRRLIDVKGNAEETMRIEAELQQVGFRLMEDAERKRYQGWQNLARGLEGVFSNAFASVLDGSKDFFSSLLDGFKQMITQMLAQAIAAGLIRSLFGGGNFLTGFMGVFGFDSAGNDAKAHRWGWDFAREFAGGSKEYQQQRMGGGQSRMAAAGAGPGVRDVNVHIGNFNNYTEADTRRIASEIAQETRRELRRSVG